MRLILRIAGVFIAVIAIAIGSFRSLPVDVVAVGLPVRQDDYLYTVTRVAIQQENKKISYVVSIKVDNNAKRVVYQWSDDVAYVMDAAGNRYRALKSGLPGGQGAPAILPGGSATFHLTFELPATASNPMLRYSNGILMGDVFDFGAYARAAVPL